MTTSSPPALVPWLRSLSQIALLITWAKCSSYLLNSQEQVSVSCQLAELFTQANHVFFHGNQGTPSPLDTPKPSSHSPSCFPRSRGQPRVALQCAHWPPPLSCEDTWLINFCGPHLSGVGCCLLKNPHNPEGTFPVTNGDKRR